MTADVLTPFENAHNSREPDSWTPKDLTQLPDKPPVQPNLGQSGIVYPGKRHVFSGPPESAKTLCAYAIGIATIRHGGIVILIDFEMGEYDCRDRLRELGATTQEISQGIRYLEPDQPATPERVKALVTLKPQLVIIDAGAGVYDLEDLDDNKRKDVGKIARLYVHPFWRNGIASILIDHVVKNTETRGKFAIGSERKLGGADVHLGFETVRAISRGTTGLYKILTHKDRGGYLKRGRLADLELESDPDTYRISWTLKTPDTASDDEGHFRPTHLMEKVSRHLELQHEPVTRTSIFDALGGTKDYVFKAITALVAEGFAAEADGDGRSKPVSRVSIYRADDPDCNPEKQSSGTVLCSSETVPEPLIGSAERTGSERFGEPDIEIGSAVRSSRREATDPNRTISDPKTEERFGGSWLDDMAATVDLDVPLDPPDHHPQ